VLPAIPSFDAAFERLAVFCRWPHDDLLPLRYQAITRSTTSFSSHQRRP